MPTPLTSRSAAVAIAAAAAAGAGDARPMGSGVVQYWIDASKVGSLWWIAIGKYAKRILARLSVRFPMEMDPDLRRPRDA
ncbi:hypothetical protein SMMN14_07481 [Sphaerulina musiva]